MSYEYDPLGRRRAKIVNGVTTKYVSDGAEEIEERDGSNNVLRRYAYGPSIDDRIAMFDTSACAHSTSNQSWCFYLTNWQDSTTTLVRRSGATPDVYHYGPYGEGTNWAPLDALTGNPFRYTGRRVDPETGLYYYRARYYSPKHGRFLQVDPIGTKDDLNLYGYVGGDPLNVNDPSGATACDPRPRDRDPQVIDCIMRPLVKAYEQARRAELAARAAITAARHGIRQIGAVAGNASINVGFATGYDAKIKGFRFTGTVKAGASGAVGVQTNLLGSAQYYLRADAGVRLKNEKRDRSVRVATTPEFRLESKGVNVVSALTSSSYWRNATSGEWEGFEIQDGPTEVGANEKGVSFAFHGLELGMSWDQEGYERDLNGD